MDFNTIKYNYDHKLWNKQMVKMAVRKGAITKSQYTLITGDPYKE